MAALTKKIDIIISISDNDLEFAIGNSYWGYTFVPCNYNYIEICLVIQHLITHTKSRKKADVIIKRFLLSMAFLQGLTDKTDTSQLPIKDVVKAWQAGKVDYEATLATISFMANTERIEMNRKNDASNGQTNGNKIEPVQIRPNKAP